MWSANEIVNALQMSEQYNVIVTALATMVFYILVSCWKECFLLSS